MGLFDMQQNPFIQSQNTVNLGNIHTGTIFDPLVQLGAQLNAQNNDALIQQQAQKQAELKRQQQLQDMQTKQDNAVALKQLDIAHQEAVAKAKEAKAQKLLAAKANALVKKAALGGKTLSLQDAMVLAQGGVGLPSKGQTIQVNVDTGKLPIGKVGQNEIDKSLINNSALADGVKRLDKEAKSLPDRFWTIQGRIGSTVDDFLSKVGFNLDRGARDKFISLQRDAGALFDTYRKSVTGAQASVRELEILKERMPVVDGVINFDSKGDFFAKLRSLNDFQKAVHERNVKLKKEGISIIPSNNGSLVGIDRNGNKVDVESRFPLNLSSITGGIIGSRGANAISNPVTANIKGKGAVTFPNQAAFDKFKKTFPDLVQ